ncbi:hypothetical protein LMK08_15080 [Metapseudomonas furukawaii]|uniref:hypothetical protein n=1 Tax=Metapseudomonas furukawaii TaxID=1149133 RepID=UPI00227A9CE2|nr:hypothetical protein [Pseudomonas furukawaii]WAG76705.1 hypothetical protein LMK08_15080 [Pseudomonas furukawaii]
MNSLDSYDNPTDALNQRILARAPRERPEGKKTTFFFTSEPEFNAAPMSLSGSVYPFTPLGSVGALQVETSGQTWRYVRNQFKNRHGLTTNPGHLERADQLVLLDTEDAMKIKEAVQRDRQFTGGSLLMPDPATTFGTTNPVHAYAAQWLVEHRDRLYSQPWDSDTHNYLRILSTDKNAYDKVYNWMQQYGTTSHKFSVNDHKSGQRIHNHLGNLGNSKAQHFSSETRGEYAATKLLITVLGEQFQMKLGKSSSGRTNGIDQIWVKRDLYTGKVLEYLIVECKGSVDAELGESSTYGWQMSTRWVFYCLIGLLGTNGNLASTSTTDVFAKKSMVNKILDALINPGATPVRGVVIQPMTKAKVNAGSIEMLDLGCYSLVQAYTEAKANTSVWGSAKSMTLDML